MQAYFWDLFVKNIGYLVSLIALFTFFIFVGDILARFYRFVFVHCPKGYGYGTLARKLIEKKLIALDGTMIVKNVENNDLAQTSLPG